MPNKIEATSGQDTIPAHSSMNIIQLLALDKYTQTFHVVSQNHCVWSKFWPSILHYSLVHLIWQIRGTQITCNLHNIWHCTIFWVETLQCPLISGEKHILMSSYLKMIFMIEPCHDISSTTGQISLRQNLKLAHIILWQQTIARDAKVSIQTPAPWN